MLFPHIAGQHSSHAVSATGALPLEEESRMQTSLNPMRTLALMLSLIATLGACQENRNSNTATPIPAQSATTSQEEYRLADFIDGVTTLIPPESPEAKVRNAKTTTLKTRQGANTDAGSYAEKSGDDFIDHSRSIVVNGIASIAGKLGKKNGSGYGGVLLITPSGSAEGVDLTAYRYLKITLAATGTYRNLQVRLTGADGQAVFRGCYPITNIKVDAEPKEYTIALNDENFPQLSWCKDLNLPVAQTLKSVRTVDAQDINMPEKARDETIVELHVGSIRFTDKP